MTVSRLFGEGFRAKEDDLPARQPDEGRGTDGALGFMQAPGLGSPRIRQAGRDENVACEDKSLAGAGSGHPMPLGAEDSAVRDVRRDDWGRGRAARAAVHVSGGSLIVEE